MPGNLHFEGGKKADVITFRRITREADSENGRQMEIHVITSRRGFGVSSIEPSVK